MKVKGYLNHLNLWLLPVILLVLIWGETIEEYYVFPINIEKKIINKAIKFPEKKIGEVTEKLEFGLQFRDYKKNDILTMAQGIVNGKINIPKFDKTLFKQPFDKDLIYKFNSHWQLSYCGFIIPELLIKAYDISNDIRYLEAARDFILGWHEYEQTLWLPRGFVWNDHAMSSRAIVLSDFWLRYKQHSIFIAADAIKIFQLANQLAGLLANDSFYAYRTNHGTMQSLALFKLASYFPLLENMENYRNKSVERLNNQFLFLINNEGAVLEHSAGYQRFGVSLLNSAIKLFELYNIPISKLFLDKYKKSELFLNHLRRPDDSFPAIGDTNVSGAKPQNRNTYKRKSELIDLSINEIILEKAGYAIWTGKDTQTDERMTHTAIMWSYFSHMGHKHADELSLNIWGDGQSWLTSVGYWPYTSRERERAIGWSGSNAPHLENEKKSSIRASKIISTGGVKKVRFIELQRTEQSGFIVRRQILQIGSDSWVVFDSFRDQEKNRNARIIWTTNAELKINKRGENFFNMLNVSTGKQMNVQFQSSDKKIVKVDFANKETLIGWNASGQEIIPANAFVVNLPSQMSWSVMELQNEQIDGIKPKSVVDWSNNENWRLKQNSGIVIVRSGQEIIVKSNDPSGINESFNLNIIPESEQYDEAVMLAFKDVQSVYGSPFHPLIKYRKKVSVAVLFLVLGIGVLLLLLRKRELFYLNLMISSAWISLTIWLTNVYFIVPLI